MSELSFAIKGMKNGTPGLWKLTAPNIGEARRRAAALGVTVTEAMFAPSPPQPPARQMPAAQTITLRLAADQDDSLSQLASAARQPRRVKRQRQGPVADYIAIHPMDAFAWGFWAGLGAWFAMVVLSFALFLVIVIFFGGIGAIAAHGR